MRVLCLIRCCRCGSVSFLESYSRVGDREDVLLGTGARVGCRVITLKILTSCRMHARAYPDERGAYTMYNMGKWHYVMLWLACYVHILAPLNP